MDIKMKKIERVLITTIESDMGLDVTNHVALPLEACAQHIDMKLRMFHETRGQDYDEDHTERITEKSELYYRVGNTSIIIRCKPITLWLTPEEMADIVDIMNGVRESD